MLVHSAKEKRLLCLEKLCQKSTSQLVDQVTPIPCTKTKSVTLDGKPKAVEFADTVKPNVGLLSVQLFPFTCVFL